MTTEQPRQVNDAGTFVYDANHKSNGDVTEGRLTLRAADDGVTFEVVSATSCCDELRLHPTDSYHYYDGSNADGARALAIYTSAPFHRWGDRPRIAALP